MDKQIPIVGVVVLCILALFVGALGHSAMIEPQIITTEKIVEIPVTQILEVPTEVLVKVPIEVIKEVEVEKLIEVFPADYEELQAKVAQEMDEPLMKFYAWAKSEVEKDLDVVDKCGIKTYKDNEIDIDWNTKFIKISDIDFNDNEYCVEIKTDKIEYDDNYGNVCQRGTVPIKVCVDKHNNVDVV